MPKKSLRVLAVAAAVWLPIAPAGATWSIVAVDRATGESAVASATCVAGVDLAVLTPIVVVGAGAGAAQSYVDQSGVNRRTIFDGLIAGDSPDDILAQLAAQDGGHQTRQYGIADVPPNPEVTFTGLQAGGWAGGLTGSVGDIDYAIQGNVLTGAPVVDEAEAAFVAYAGDMPAKLMAAMLAAYAMGGDGRCSCAYFSPEACGSPPPTFDKSAHVGYIIVSRRGDVDGSCSAAVGCANGDYYMRLNVAGQSPAQPDPVLQLRDLFQVHRGSWVGRPDHYQSTIEFETPRYSLVGLRKVQATVTLVDWRGDPLTAGGAQVWALLHPQSPVQATLGPVTDHGDGTYTFDVRPDPGPGDVILQVGVDDGQGPILLGPPPVLQLP